MLRPNLLLVLAAAVISAAPRVAIITPKDLPPPAQYGIDRLATALRAKGVAIVPRDSANILIEARISSELGEQALSVSKRNSIKGQEITLTGGDSTGLMYAALDAADRVSWSGKSDPLEQVRTVAERPYLKERAVSIYTMHRRQFESRLLDERHWQRFFDLLARSRINRFVVIFGYENGGFMAPAYPYFFDVDGFPSVQLVGITPAEQARHTAAFKVMIRTAHERGIAVTAALWDHIYRGGVQGGGIPGASEAAGKSLPGLVTGIDTGNVAAYNKAAIRRFLEVFPEIDALQFRMHPESGLKPEEMAGFWHEVFQMIKTLRPGIRVDLRAKELPDSIIEDALAQGINARITTKYWMEQIGLPFHPTHVNRQNQQDRRHGYADLLRYPQKYQMVWRLWNGGTTRLLLWGDPEFVRRFAESARLYNGDSFEVNEMLATKMLGEPHDAPPRPILSPGSQYYDDEFERYWHFYQLWGRLSYNPATSPEIWTREFQRRFGPAGPSVMQGLHEASQVLPRIVAAAYPYSAFPTTRGWAEMQSFGDLPRYAATIEGSDTEQFMSLTQRAQAILKGTLDSRRTPEETSQWFASISGSILANVAEARRLAPKPQSKELASTLTDLQILARLADFHSHRLIAGLNYSLYTASGSLTALDGALVEERQAVDAWSRIVDAAGGIYSEDLAFGPHAVGFPRHWKEELARLRAGLSKLEQDRAVRPPPDTVAASIAPRWSAGASVSARVPVAVLSPGGSASPGQDLIVSVRVSNPSLAKSVVLRYRHVNQYEDYVSVPMKLREMNRFTAVIPGRFVTASWDLMYFVEVLAANGSGRNYPDMEKGAPYVIVPVAR